MNVRLDLIQQLIPLGLEAVNQELQAEVIRLVGDVIVDHFHGSFSWIIFMDHFHGNY